ncbi:MAG: T9SS type A sorting domain-containing protein [candidate division WOR-3 bacterium]
MKDIKRLVLLIFLLTFVAAQAKDLKPENSAKLRWGTDLLLYDGKVRIDFWGASYGIDDDEIDMDYFADSTVLTVVACPDSTLRVFKSLNSGESWSLVEEVKFSNEITEPYVIRGSDTTYHIFCRHFFSGGDIYSASYKISNDELIPGTSQFLAQANDSVNSYSVCSDRGIRSNYSIFVAYAGGTESNAKIKFTKTQDRGFTWSTPTQIATGNVSLPDITYAPDSILYLAYRSFSDGKYMIRVRRSLNLGNSWGFFPFWPKTLESDSNFKMRPKIAAAYDGSGNVWVIWAKYANEWNLMWSWSQDSAVTWSTPQAANSTPENQEILPNIMIFENPTFGLNPFVSYVRATSDWQNPIVRSFIWYSNDSAWGPDTSYADYPTSLIRPAVTMFTLFPAIAYVGENNEKVYFDSWGNTQGIEEDIVNRKISCILDRSIATNEATLRYTLPIRGYVNVSLFNPLGQEVRTLFEGINEIGENTLTFTTDGLSQGIYYIVVNTPSGTGTAKLAVIK